MEISLVKLSQTNRANDLILAVSFIGVKYAKKAGAREACPPIVY
jgi:hypothetical protein